MKLQYKILIGLAALAVSFGIGYYATPTKIKENVRIEYKDSKVEVKTKIVYRDKITKPDGTIIEKEVEKEDTNTKEESETKIATEKIAVKDAGLVLGVLGVKSIKDITGDTGIQIGVSKRVLGALGIAGSVTGYEDEKLIAVGISWSF